MSMSLGVSHLALPNPPARATTLQSGCSSSFSSPLWKENAFSSFSLRAWPNSAGRVSRQVHQEEAGDEIFAQKGLAKDVAGAAAGEFSEEEDFVRDASVASRAGGGPSALRPPPNRTSGRFWRRFPGAPQGDSQDLTVPTEALRKGAVFRGTVSSVQPFGAFVSFGAFADGLVHISKLSAEYVKNVGDVVELGQEVTVSVLKVEESTGRISLSLLEKDRMDLRKPYVSRGPEEPGRRGERPRFQAGSGRSAATVGEREERLSKGNYASSSRSVDFSEGGERPRYQPGSGRTSRSRWEEEQERFSSNPNGSLRHQESRRRGGEGEGPNFQPGSGRRYPFAVEKEDEIAWDSFASTKLGEAGERDRLSKDAFGSTRKGQFGGEDRQARNSFALSGQEEARREDRTLKDSSFSSMIREEGSSNHFQPQGSEDSFKSTGRITRVGEGRDSQTKPKLKLVQIPKAVEPEEDKLTPRMRMNTWYDCDCC